MLRVQLFHQSKRYRQGWLNKMSENIAKNRIHAEKVRKQRDFEATAIPWKKYKKIKMLEREGLNTQNYQWQGWSDEEINVKYDQQVRREKLLKRKKEKLESLSDILEYEDSKDAAEKQKASLCERLSEFILF